MVGLVVTRRELGRMILAVGAGIVALGRGQRVFAWRQPLRTVYVFDPTAETSAYGSCATCAACRRHATHKVFASRATADARRAHPHCRCAIREVSVESTVFARMFGWDGPSTRGEFDRRWSGGASEVTGGLEMPADWVR